MARTSKTSITPDNLGEIVRQIRTEQELTQEDLATKIGKGRLAIHRLEKGDAKGMSFETIHSIFKALGKDICYK